MSKIVYVYSRKGNFDNGMKNILSSICDQLVPDNITSRPVHRIHVQDRTAYAIINDTPLCVVNGLSVMLGMIFEDPCEYWHTPGAVFPDGNYIIIRNNNQIIEVVSDAAGSRTIWYYLDEELFIASTSQRAIIKLLGNFQFDNNVIPWMLSTGTLGPELSWDRRIKRLQPDSSVVLEKTRWNLIINNNPITFSEINRSEEEHKEVLKNAIAETIRSLSSLDLNKWKFPLSGGCDSRGILCFMKNSFTLPADFKTITWGVKSSVEKEGSDANVAICLAKKLNIIHEYLSTDLSDEPIEQVVDRLIKCAEGRIDHISGYMDGLNIWKSLFENGVIGIIRGDHGMGRNKYSSEYMVKTTANCRLCSDFSNLKGFEEKHGISTQILPHYLTRKKGESLDQWRDRLIHLYNIPSVLAALSDIKLSYCEQISPLLSRNILTVSRGLPDRFRNNKKIWKEIVRDIGPDIPFANEGANRDSVDIMQHYDFAVMLKFKLSDCNATKVFSPGFIKNVKGGIKIGGTNPDYKSRINIVLSMLKKITPKTIINALKDVKVSNKVKGNRLAFRVYVILRMLEILESDAVNGKNV